MHAPLPLFDAAALRTLEAQAAAALGGDDFELMRRAGQAAWRYLLEHWPQAQRIVIACGPGNNGGDGYVLARHALVSGRDVRVVASETGAPQRPAAARAQAEYLDAGGRVLGIEGFAEADLVVDALFGIGLSRAPAGAAAALIEAIDAARVPVLALDAPSGIDADTGHRPSIAVRASRTLQFIAAHAGLVTGEALDHAGATDIAALDVPAAAWAGVAPMAGWLRPAALADLLPPRPRNSHKGRHGHVLCVGGDAGMGGAIVLCAQAALRSGAGLVSVATRAAHVPALLARSPECMAAAIEDVRDGDRLFERASVIAIGPGLGMGDWGRGLLDRAFASGKPLVLDADALNLLADSPRGLRDAVLTPHPGEAARLLGMDVAQIQADRYSAARKLAQAFDCSVVLKGAGSIVAAPGRMPEAIGAGNPGMAVGGMGDVLTGTIAALRAQGLDAFDAARCGALLHAHAGDIAAREGERGLLPTDVVACLRAAANPSSTR